LENFANGTRPNKPILGMLWFNTEDSSLYVCVNENEENDNENKSWIKVMLMQDSSDQKIHYDGDITYDKDEKALKVYDTQEEEWITVGPINYTNKRNFSEIIRTYAGQKINSTVIDLSYESKMNSTYLVTAKVVAREKYSEDFENQINFRTPQSAAWICNVLVENYRDETQIIGSPNYQVIAKSSGSASDWNVEAKLNDDNNLILTVQGTGVNATEITQERYHVDWEIDVEIVKV
jgi:hypothetical protein